jgi:hypothetical protein
MHEFPPLSELIILAVKQSPAEFGMRFRDHYLITECIGTTAGWNVPTGYPPATTEIPAFQPGDRGFLGVTPVVKRDGANPYSSMITLGRARNNDVPITDISVSKLHAWIRRGDNGTFDSGPYTITDAGSRNGTFVNGQEVFREACALPVGAKLRLGLVEFVFVDVGGLYVALRNAPHQLVDDFR